MTQYKALHHRTGPDSRPQITTEATTATENPPNTTKKQQQEPSYIEQVTIELGNVIYLIQFCIREDF